MKVVSEASLRFGVVVERREIDNRWQDYSWRAIAVIPNAPETEGWRLLHSGENWVQFHARTLKLELFKRETQGYRVNLSMPTPSVFVVLRPGEESGEEEVEPFLLTVCPYEAESYVESGDEIVDGVPMPSELIALLHEFVETHHVEQPFKKRKNKKAYDPSRGDFSRKPSGEHGGGEQGGSGHDIH